MALKPASTCFLQASTSCASEESTHIFDLVVTSIVFLSNLDFIVIELSNLSVPFDRCSYRDLHCILGCLSLFSSLPVFDVYSFGLLVVGSLLLEDCFDNLGLFLIGHLTVGFDRRLVSANSEIA